MVRTVYARMGGAASMRLAYKWQAALVVALGVFMPVLDTTVVAVALPQMQSYFHTDRATINWVATGYLLAQAAVIPITGYLSDRIGAKSVFLGALALFTVGSVLCAIAPNEQLLIAFRVLQGIGGGALFPIAFAIIFRIFPPAERGAAAAVTSVPVLLAPAFGPTVGGWLTTTFDWHAIFFVNLPVGVIALVLGLLVLRGRDGDATSTLQARARSAALALEPAPARQRLDVLGLALVMGGFTSLVYGISEAGNTSWTNQTVVVAVIISALLLVAFVVTALRTSEPVLDVRLFRNPTFTMANVLLWSISAFLFSTLFLLPIFFQQVQGHTPLQSGAYFILQGVATAAATAVSGWLYNRVGPRILALLGFFLITIGTIGFTQLSVGTTWQSLQVWLVLRGLGLGLAMTPLSTLALAIVSNRQLARASSLVNVMRQVAGAIGLSALTTYFASQSAAHMTTQSFPVAATSALNDVFLVALLACAVSTVLALFLGRDPNLATAEQAMVRGETGLVRGAPQPAASRPTSQLTVLQNLPFSAEASKVFSSSFFRFPDLRGQFHGRREEPASALPSTGVLGVRRTPGHPGTRPAMSDAGAERDGIFAPPGFQHRQQSSTNGLSRQDTHNATKEQTMPEKQESVFTLWTERAKKTLGLAGTAATGVKIAPPDAAPGLISYQEVHSSTSKTIDNKKRRKGASPGRARQPDTSARDRLRRRQDRYRDVNPRGGRR
jgi:EmrB/QacA subfamily drug resistance transporter